MTAGLMGLLILFRYLNNRLDKLEAQRDAEKDLLKIERDERSRKRQQELNNFKRKPK